jgi:hypothetical protein
MPSIHCPSGDLALNTKKPAACSLANRRAWPGQARPEDGAALRVVVGAELAAVALDDPPCQGQAQARARGLAGLSKPSNWAMLGLILIESTTRLRSSSA